MAPITSVHARQILDSRGNPTVEVEVSDGTLTARAAVPSGASTGIYEALELRDKDKEVYHGKGVLTAVENVNGPLAECVAGMEPGDQEALDQAMLDLDGTENKSKLGANAILGISLAAARLAAMQQGIPLFVHIQNLFQSEDIALPKPMMNVINGGSHADSGLEIQEFMIQPQFEAFEDNLRAGSEIFHTLKKILKSQGHVVAVGDEGGFAPHLDKNEDALKVLVQAVEETGYTTDNVKFCLDAAASEFYKDGKYTVDGKQITSEELTAYYADLVEKYPIVSIEDSHDEDDFAGFKALTEQCGDTGQIVGDDLFVTNIKRLQMGIDQGVGNSILIKVNQIGSLSETFETMKLAEAHGYTTVISHRSGETEDTFIADLAVGTNAGQIKTGSLSRSDRIAKYNQLLRIEEDLDASARYLGRDSFYQLKG